MPGFVWLNKGGEGKPALLPSFLRKLQNITKGRVGFPLRSYQENTIGVCISKAALRTSHWAAVRLWLSTSSPERRLFYTADFFLHSRESLRWNALFFNLPSVTSHSFHKSLADKRRERQGLDFLLSGRENTKESLCFVLFWMMWSCFAGRQIKKTNEFLLHFCIFSMPLAQLKPNSALMAGSSYF